MECDQIFVKWFKTKLKPKKLMKTLTKWQNALEWSACYFENHDQPRFISRFEDLGNYRKEASKMVAGLLMTLRGTPFVFEGQELGMTNGDFADLGEVMDIESHNVYAMAKGLGIPARIRWKMIERTSRDNARTPMQWTGGENAGFTSGEPWLKVNANYTQVNAEAESADKDGVLSFWKKMIHFRKANEILREGSFKSVYEGARVYAYEREYQGKKLLCVCNMTSKISSLPLCAEEWDKTVLSSYKTVCKKYMKPFEFRIMVKKEAEG
jgi:oligo-1,6-glucosidase